MSRTRAKLEGLYTALEHEAMHQETLLYMWHRLPYEQKRRPMDDARPAARGGGEPMADALRATIPGGTASLGAQRRDGAFGWDNEFDQHTVHVPPFDIDVLPVTNAQFVEFVNDGGYTRRELWDDEGRDWIQAGRVHYPAFWLPADASVIEHRIPAIGHRPSAIGDWRWRGMFEAMPLPPDWPVYVSQAEASAYARWKRRRLMTEAEFHRASEGAASATPTSPVSIRCRWDRPAGTASTHGVHDLIGNGWEWTSTVFGPFDGFEPMRSYPEYSADFFDGRHVVMKGASPATARELIRPSFRNWFRATYPYVYAKFRTVDHRG